ncbi:hypothetical protein BC332_13910 [Capsicum chinense]|nr:hypothetical protein BC332_13910 [Capsicum chinense]
MVLQNKSDGCDSRFIQEIVKVVTGNLNHAVLSISLFPVGIDSRFDIMSTYGIGGIGKSTLVKTAYNLNFNKFDCNNFLAIVNKTSERHNGLLSLQNEINEMLDHLRRIKSGVKLIKKSKRIVKRLCVDFIGIPDEWKTNHDMKRLESQLLEVINEIKPINAKVTVMWSANIALKPYYVVVPSKHLPSQQKNLVCDDDEIVGFDIATEKLIWHLTQGTRLGREEEDDDDSILDDDDDDEDEEVTLAEIEKLFGDLSERNGTMLQQCLNIDELKLPDKVGHLGLHGSECPSRLGPSSGHDSDEKVEK